MADFVKNPGQCFKKYSPSPLWGHRLPVTALALSARRLDKANRSLRSLWRSTTRITSADRDDLKLGYGTSLKLPAMTFKQMTFLINRNKIILTVMVNWLLNDIAIFQQRSKLVVVCNRMKYAVACIYCARPWRCLWHQKRHLQILAGWREALKKISFHDNWSQKYWCRLPLLCACVYI